jgi:preprotein translocase subunit Sss1
LSTPLRVILTVLAALAGLSLMSFALLIAFPSEVSLPVQILQLVLRLLAAYWAARLVWRRPTSQSYSAGMARSIALGALLIGGVGFFAGFFGPLIFTPGANQGPLLGIFITGPLGLILGAIGGAVRFHWLRKRGTE